MSESIPAEPKRSRPRNIQCVPGGFHWCGNDVSEQIVKDIKDGGKCLAIYYALCRLSSDENNKPTLRASLEAIAAKCGISPKTVWRHVNELARGGFVSIEPGPKNSRIPNQYTLLHERVANDPEA